MEKKENYYNILGVNESASADEIKKAFRKLSLKHHPDKGGDVNKFKNINEAYQTLGTDEKRKQYDHMRKFGGNMNGANFQSSSFNGMPFNMGGFPEEVFKHMFNSGGSGPGHFEFNVHGNGSNPNIRIFRTGNMGGGQRKPPIITQTITITIQEAYTGCSKPMEVERWIQEEENMKRVEKETIYVDIPEGVDNNEAILLRDKGNVFSETNKGDIRVIIKVENNTELKREGLNLIFLKTLTLKESLCGFTFTIHHINGKEYKINNQNTVISPNYRKVVQNLGFKRGNRNGNLYIIFNVEFPTSLTDVQIEKLNDILE
jgi:DnaJ-class molecular chaperone